MNAPVAAPQPTGRFELGRILITRGVEASISPESMMQMISRHHEGDWGDVCDDDKAVNDQSLENGWRLLSEYREAGQRLWVITEADRSVTTLLLPEEY